MRNLILSFSTATLISFSLSGVQVAAQPAKNFNRVATFHVIDNLPLGN